MVSSAVSLQGRAVPHFAPEETYVDMPYFLGEMLASRLSPQIRIAAGGQPFVWMQDQAKPHVTAATKNWLGRQMEGPLKCWPSKGGNLTTWEYGAWSQAQESIWADKPATPSELRTFTLRHLAALPDEKIRKSPAASPKRARLYVEAKGGYFEKNDAGAL